MLYALQEGDMDVQEGYMLKKIMMFIVATNIIASRPPKRRPIMTIFVTTPTTTQHNLNLNTTVGLDTTLQTTHTN